MVELKYQVPCFFQPHARCYNFCENHEQTRNSIKIQESTGINTSDCIDSWQLQPLEKQVEREMLGWINNPSRIGNCVIYNGDASEYIDTIPAKLL